MQINNKIESYNKIVELNLNRFPEKIFKQGQQDLIKDFIKKYPAEYYAIRDKSKAGGVFKLKVTADDLLKETYGYEKFSINVSSYNYIKNQLLVGEIFFTRDGFVAGTLSQNPSYSVRDALKNPDYNFKTNIFDKYIDEIPCFDKIYEYVSKHQLFDIIVEFACFDISVGVNNENIVVYEIRTSY